MCTVTYIPQGNNNFILSSNRDESPARSPQWISRRSAPVPRLVYPRDAAAGGTWIAAAADNRVACLLNGAFEKHKHQPPYRKSRGLMVLEFFEFPSALAFLQQYDFEGIEPFTLVIVDKGNLCELRWDGANTSFKNMNAELPHLWSSATLYPGDIGKIREGWFRDWLHERSDFSLKAVRYLHRHGGSGDLRNGFIMNRDNIVQTVSITHVVKNADDMVMTYHDLLRDTHSSESVALEEFSGRPAAAAM